MTISDRLKLKFVSWALMLALAAILATRASAEEASSKSSSDVKASESGTQSPNSSAAGENAAPVSSGADTENIDTRITVQPHGPPGKSGKVGGTTNPIQPLKLINAHRRMFSPSRAANRISPNASGVLNGQRQVLQQRLEEHFQSNVRPTPAIGTAARVGNADVGVVKPGSHLGREPIFHPPVISPVGGSAKTLKGSVGGPSSNHHAVGANAVGIGGPARVTTGINGTLIHTTH